MFVFDSQGWLTAGVIPIWYKEKWAEILHLEGMPTLINMNGSTEGFPKMQLCPSRCFLAEVLG